MANWNNPLLTSLYSDVLAEFKARDVDVATMFNAAPSNQPANAMRYNRSTNIFEEWDGAAWNAKTIAVAGGGTGSGTAAGARTNLGIGTLGVQNSNAIAVTGGTISGLTAFEMNGPITFAADDASDIGAFAKQARKIYVKSALVAPVGVDKYTTT